MAGGLAIIVNGNANRGRFLRPGFRPPGVDPGVGAAGPWRASGLDQLRAALGSDERLFVTQSMADLDRAAAALVAEPAETLGLVGGDGTISASLTALYRLGGEVLPQNLLLLRGGTMNTVASGLGIRRGDPLAGLARYRRAAPGAGHRAYTIEAQGRLGFLFSAGLMYTFLAEYYRQPLGTGPLGAAGLLAAGIGSALTGGALSARLASPLRARLTVDGCPMAVTNYLFVGAATVAEVGIGFAPYARVGRVGGGRPAGFHVLGYQGRIRQLAAALPRFARGQGPRDAETLDRLCKQLLIEPETGGLPFALDGDLHRAQGSLRLGLGPSFRILP